MTTAISKIAKLAGFVFVASAGVAAAQTATYYTKASECDANVAPRQRGACKSCVNSGKGEVWINGQGCGAPPPFAAGSVVWNDADCSRVTGAATECTTCIKTTKGQYVVGTGCLKDPQTLPKGWFITTEAECKKITAATKVVECIQCLRDHKKWTLGSGCWQ